jgi:hypothetical protein
VASGSLKGGRAVSYYETVPAVKRLCVVNVESQSLPGRVPVGREDRTVSASALLEAKGAKEVVLVGNHLVRHMGHGPTFTQPGHQLPKPVGKRF